MLVLSRKQGESIEIGDRQVLVRVLGIKRSKVQLGIDAPHDVEIHRSEKAEQHCSKFKEESRESARIAPYSGAAVSDAAKPSSQAGRVLNSNGAAQRSSSHRNAAGQLDAILGENVLDDLARAQAEIAALAELVARKDREVARQVAAAVVDRLTGIEKSVRLARRQKSELPIAAFIDSDRVDPKNQGNHGDQLADEAEHSEAWGDSCGEESTLLRESRPNFKASKSSCSIA